MNEDCPQINVAVKRFAVLTCCVALLPISIGALVTTLKAGMAFADWPTSDGQNMLLYPWLQDLRNTDKFVEHGHRLAGMLIGVVSIGLVLVTFLKEKRSWVRVFSVAILVAVVGQGLLGGMRVRMNEQVLAMAHSVTGGLFFTLCFLFAFLTNRTNRSNRESDSRIGPATFALGVLLPVAVLGQYVLGGLFRHQGRMLHEHLAGAVVVSILCIVLSFVLFRSTLPTLRRTGQWLTGALFLQVAMGLGSWITRLGLPSAGWVAVANSPAQNVICSAHTVGGMLLLATSTVTAAELIIANKAGQARGMSLGFADEAGLPVSRGGIG